MQPKWLPFRLRSCWPAVPGCWTPKGAAARIQQPTALHSDGSRPTAVTLDSGWPVGRSFLVYQEELRAIGLAVGGDRGVL